MDTPNSNRRMVSAKQGGIIIVVVLGVAIGVGIAVAPDSSSRSDTGAVGQSNKIDQNKIETKKVLSQSFLYRAKKADEIAQEILARIEENNPNIPLEEKVKQVFMVDTDPFVRATTLTRYKGALKSQNTYIPPMYFEMASAFALSLPTSELKEQFTGMVFNDLINGPTIRPKETIEQYRRLANNPEEALKQELVLASRASAVLNMQRFVDFLVTHPSGDPRS